MCDNTDKTAFKCIVEGYHANDPNLNNAINVVLMGSSVRAIMSSDL